MSFYLLTRLPTLGYRGKARELIAEAVKRVVLCLMPLYNFIYMLAMLPGYLDTDMDTRYVDTPIHHFSKNTNTGIREYIYNIYKNVPD